MLLLLWIALAIVDRIALGCNDSEDHLARNDPTGLFSPYYDPVTDTANPWLTMAFQSKNHPPHAGN